MGVNVRKGGAWERLPGTNSLFNYVDRGDNQEIESEGLSQWSHLESTNSGGKCSTLQSRAPRLG